MDTASTSSRTGERHSRLIKPGKCNGTSDWETYTTKFQVIAQVNGWTASEKTAHLVAALDGPAEQALLDLPYGQELEFEALCTALQRRFGKRSSELELRDQLYARRREAGEKLGVLDADIEQLACRAFKGVPLELTVQLALDLFIRGLFPSELRRHAHLGHPRCQEMEAILMEESILEPEPSKLQTFLGLRAKGNPRGEAVCAAQPAQPRKPPCCRQCHRHLTRPRRYEGTAASQRFGLVEGQPTRLTAPSKPPTLEFVGHMGQGRSLYIQCQLNGFQLQALILSVMLYISCGFTVLYKTTYHELYYAFVIVL
ncbi:UNVERIFIED_CONTAM: hypothetical protein FKN15_013040 [Acipenser sinensis]